MKHTYLALPVIALLAACTSAGTPAPISANPGGGAVTAVTNLPAPLSPTNATIGTDLTSAGFNLDQAVAIGALPPGDPADTCIDAILVQAGLSGTTTPPAASFQPKNDGLASLGAIAYIDAQQLLALQANGGFAITPSCYAIIGKIIVDAAKAGFQIAPSVISAIPGALPLPLAAKPEAMPTMHHHYMHKEHVEHPAKLTPAPQMCPAEKACPAATQNASPAPSAVTPMTPAARP